MYRFWPKRITFDMAIRMIADAVMINAAFLSGLTLRYLWGVGFEGTAILARTALRSHVAAYTGSAWLLTLISLIIFYWSGFYTHGRRYRGRYKALVIAQAVSLSYLIFGSLAFLLPDFISLPRSVLILAWAITLALLIGARLWARLWIAMNQAERRLLGSQVEGADQIKTVLVIGGAGYIGSALLPKLLDKGYHVRLLDLLFYGTEPIEDVLKHPRLELIQADFRQVDKVVEAMQGMDAVIHLGAIVGDPACALNEELTIEVNLMATRMIAEVAKGSGVSRFIFASTCSVYGASDEVLNELSALHPVSLYARSKIASEKVLMRLADAKFAPIILRFGTIYGLSGRTRFDLVVNLLTAKALVEGKITIFGGDQWRPFVHVDDAALAVQKVLEASLSQVSNQVYNVGSNDQNYTIQQIGEIVHGLVPAAELISMGSDTDKRNYRVNFSKFENNLGFKPRWIIEQGINQVIEAIRSGKVQDYRDAKYSNVKFLSEEEDLVRPQNGWAYDLINEPFLDVAAVPDKMYAHPAPN
ncbi:MAG: NAD-dependent epimerase/dehydratase family protein [Chloroflexi bacterium]|nr:NAD-dependent epimerase/dehydratase family protein [Chloroflexota bacterium]MCI0725597.1 NAD-dependent epimerase/dehydratase family protein [Chloroflexota bacterium]